MSKKTLKKTITTVIPSPGRVLVKLLPEDDRTGSGLYIPNADQRVSVRRSIVVACGEEKLIAAAVGIDGDENDPGPPAPRYSEGDLVITSKSSGVNISVDGEEMRLVIFEDVLARVVTS